MIEITGDIFEVEADAICVTTNGIVKGNGELVMGKGIALAFARRYQGIAAQLGRAVRENGNHVHEAYRDLDVLVLSFPTKEHWRDPSPISLIEKSAKQLVVVANMWDLKKVVLPRPGCGNGGLDWETQVKPILQPILDDRFFVITPK